MTSLGQLIARRADRRRSSTLVRDVTRTYLVIKTAIAGCAATVTFMWGLTFGHMDTAVLGTLPLALSVEGLIRLRSGRLPRSMTRALFTDTTVAGLFATLLAVGSIAVAYGLMMVNLVVVLVPRKHVRLLIGYAVGWIGLGLVAAMRVGRPETWQSAPKLWFSAAHVLLGIVGTSVLISLVIQRLRTVERERSRILSGVVHDLKGALTGAVGMAELLSDNPGDLTDDEIVEYASMVVHEAWEAVAITEDLLTVERANAGHLEISLQTVDMEHQARSILESMGLASDIPLVGPATHANALAVGDPRRVRQILRNLVSNAVRHGGAEVQMAVGTTGLLVFVEMRDSGPAVPEAERKRMFAPFQHPRHRQRHVDSVGIGLSMSRDLASRMNGDVTYRHADGWSVFALNLPAVRSEPSEYIMGETLLTKMEQIWLGTDGILRSVVRPGAVVRPEDAREAMAMYLRAAGDKKRPILIHLENLRFISTEAKDTYVRSAETAQCLSAAALVVSGMPVARALANSVARFSKPPFPIRLFDDETAALAWLTQYLDSSSQKTKTRRTAPSTC